MPEKYWPETVILWGAGATRYLGIYTTKELSKIILNIVLGDFSFLENKNDVLSNSFKELVNLRLGDNGDISRIYDFEALSIIIKVNPKFNLNELFTMMDQLLENDQGFNAFVNGENRFLRVERIKAAKRCLVFLIEELERLAVQNRPGFFDEYRIKPYYDFSTVLSKLMTDEAQEFYKRGYKTDTRKFYMYSYAVVSFNWDPVLSWNIYNSSIVENRRRIDLGGGHVLEQSMDYGIQIASRSNDETGIYYTTDESTCRQINKSNNSSRLLRTGKILFPHGMFGCRVCPECGKSIADFSQNTNRLSTKCFGPSISSLLQSGWQYNTLKEKKYKNGAIECPYCGQITYPYDMPIIMQTSLRNKNMFPLYEIRSELGLLLKNARHIIFAGYSLPEDDMMVKTFFMSSIAGTNREKLSCTIINHDPKYKNMEGWIEGSNIMDYINENKYSSASRSIRSICDIFNINNTRLSLNGIPDVFIEKKKISTNKVIDLLYPQNCFGEGFPIIRKA